MKILIANASYPPNFVAGAEMVVRSLAAQLKSAGHEVVIVTTQPRGPLAVGYVDGIKVHYLPIRNIYRPFGRAKPGRFAKAIWHAIDSFNPFMGRSIGRVIDAEKPDLVNSHNLAGLSVAAMREAKRRNLPLVHTLHDQYLLCLKSTGFKRGAVCVNACVECRVCGVPRRLNAAKVDVVIGVSDFILGLHETRGYFANSRKRVVYNTVPEIGKPSPHAESPRGKVRFGFLGQLRPTKGVHHLVAAFMDECPGDAELWIAGRGDEAYEAELRALTADTESIRWLGFVDPGSLLDHIDVLVVPSVWNDTAPLVVLEALQRGIPVLGARRGGIPEFLTGECGWLFDPERPQEFRLALRTCIDAREHYPAMSASARLRAANFDLKSFVEGYLDSYRQAMLLARSASG